MKAALAPFVPREPSSQKCILTSTLGRARPNGFNLNTTNTKVHK